MERQKTQEIEIWGRAQGYAEQVNAVDKVVCAFDYYAGARDELVLLLEWKDADKECPDNDRQVLTKDRFGCYRVAWCDGGRWSEDGVEKWREIRELESLEFV
jgi:hypothetical protein